MESWIRSTRCPSIGDGLENANFKRKTANDSILALTTFDNWATEVTTSPIELAKERDGNDYGRY